MGVQFSILSDEEIEAIHTATLHILSQVGVILTHPDACQVLQEAGAEVIARDNSDGTALMYSLQMNKSTDCAALLIEYGADVNVLTAEECNATLITDTSALAIAVFRQYGAAVKLLLDSGADPNVLNRRPSSPPMTEAELSAQREISAACIAEIAAGGIPEETTDGCSMWSGRSETVLMQAAQKDSLHVAALLLENGADINATDDDGETALMKAAAMGKTGIATLLLDCGADVNATSDRGYTALACAENNDHPEMAQLLVDYGAEEKEETGAKENYIEKEAPKKEALEAALFVLNFPEELNKLAEPEAETE